MKQQPDNKNYHDSDQRKNQRIRKPALAPVGEPEAKPDQWLLPSCLLLLSWNWHGHTQSFLFGGAI
jgi:hypothetical protein